MESGENIMLTGVEVQIRLNLPVAYINVDRLIWDWCREKARELVAKRKDIHGNRIIYSTGRRGDYTNMESTDSLDEIGAISERMFKQAQGYTRTLSRVSDRLDDI
jgi:hypothetical protein